MTVEADIVACLTGLVSGRVYPDVAPATVAKPYIVYQQSGGDVVTFLESAMPSKRNGRFQVAAWATTRAQASDLMRQVEVLMVESATLRAMALGSATSLYESDTKLYGSRQFFSIWF